MGGFGDPARHNRYAVLADDLLDAAHKLGASREEVIAMLERSSFFEPTSVVRGEGEL